MTEIERTKKKILIVEDNEIVARLEKEILEREGFKVEVVRDGVEGLERIKRNRYDVIISDYVTPRMRGDKLYLEVKRLNQDSARRIIFVSGTIDNFIRATGNRFLEKPFSVQRFVEVVKDQLSSNI